MHSCPHSPRTQAADQPPSLARTTPLTFTPSSLSRKVMDAATASASAASGIPAIAVCTRPAPSGEPHDAPMLVIVAPGATALTPRPEGPSLNAALLVSPTPRSCEAG